MKSEPQVSPPPLPMPGEEWTLKHVVAVLDWSTREVRITETRQDEIRRNIDTALQALDNMLLKVSQQKAASPRLRRRPVGRRLNSVRLQLKDLKKRVG